MSNFLDLIDLASERVGGAVLASSDEFFAPKENLIKAGEAQWLADKYTDRGKWMDGWETRRRRTPGHDWVIVRLGLPGIIRGVVVDTRHFRGNYPDSCAIEVCSLPGSAGAAVVQSHRVRWRELLPDSKLEGHTKNKFEITTKDNERATHVRLRIFPDGGVARLRVYGEVMPDWDRMDFRGGVVDLAAMDNGGQIVGQSDMFFGHSQNLIMPGLPRDMSDGWETRRRRGPGHDWVILKLGAKGTIERAEVDTSYFIGNAPGSCTIEVCTTDRDLDFLTSEDCEWHTLLAETQLQPNTRHVFEGELHGTSAATHARLNVFPDGGVARLRLYGTTERSTGIRVGLARLNSLSSDAFQESMLACCGSGAWAQSMLQARPFADFSGLVRTADLAWGKLDKFDWLEAFAAHPRIGESKSGDDKFASWSRHEQSGVKDADPTIIDELNEANKDYYDRFGHNFVVYAAGRKAEDLLMLMRKRVSNDAGEELKHAAEEQRKITRLRLGKLLRSMTEAAGASDTGK